MGTKQRRDPRQCELDAYVKVLKALSMRKLDWSKQKLLTDLRKHLSISQDEYLKALDTVLKDPEVIAIRDGKPLPIPQDCPKAAAGDGGPSSAQMAPVIYPPTTLLGDDGARCQGQGQDNDAQVKDVSRKRPNGGVSGPGPGPGLGPGPGPGRIKKSSRPSMSECTSILKNTMIGSVNQLVGRKVERFRSNQACWVHAVISDYDSQKDYHCVTFNFNMLDQETWEWINVQAEVLASKLRILPGLPLNLKAVVPSVPLKAEERASVEKVRIGSDHLLLLPELCVPYEDSFFMQSLQTSSLEDLEQMLHAVTARQQSLFDQFLEQEDDSAYHTDPLVSALIEKERLERRAKKLLQEIKACAANKSNRTEP